MNFKIAGWSLLETAITISIMVMITAISLPSYRYFILQSNRQHAESYLMALSIQLEDYFLKNHDYSGADLLLDQAAPLVYRFKLNLQSKRYDLFAIPIDGQENDACGRLGLNSEGIKTAAKSDCWEAY